MPNIPLIIIIGLPGSGKTTLSNELKDEGYEVYDDFITHFYNGQVIQSIKEGKLVCLNDPRLCSYKIFERQMDTILKYITKDKIKLILFENNPEKCLQNIQARDDERKGIVDTINHYTKIYDLKKYHDYNQNVLLVP